MKFKKPKSFAPAVLTAVGVIGGAMAGRVAYSLSGVEEKDTQTQTMVKGVIALAGLGGSAFIDGDDTGASLVRGALLGMGAEQALSAMTLNAKGNVEDKTLKAAFGLGCPCQEETLATRSLNAGRVIELLPGYQTDYLRDQPMTEVNSVSVLGL